MTPQGKGLSKSVKVQYSGIKAYQPFSASFTIPIPQAQLNPLPTIPICTHTHFILQHFILFAYRWLSKFFYKYPSIPLLQVAPMQPALLACCGLTIFSLLLFQSKPTTSSIFSIVVKPFFFTCIDSTFPFNCHFALWFPIVGNKGVGTTIVVVFLPEVT